MKIYVLKVFLIISNDNIATATNFYIIETIFMRTTDKKLISVFKLNIASKIK